MRRRRQREASDCHRELAGAGLMAGAPPTKAQQSSAPHRLLPTPRHIDDTMEAGEAEAEVPRRRMVSFNEYDGPIGTIRVGFGLLTDYAAYSQDANSQEQFPDLCPNGRCGTHESCFTEVSRPSGRSAGAPGSCTTGRRRSGFFVRPT